MPVLVQFLKRNMKLYGFWFLILLPITLCVRNWFSDSFGIGLLRMLQSFFFNSTFRASWYIMALNIGVCIILFSSRRIQPGLLVCLSLPAYLLCCLSSSYYALLETNATIMGWYQGYLSVFTSICNSFPAALFWLAIGNYLAVHEIRMRKSVLLGMIFVSAVTLALEHVLVTQQSLQKVNDAYLMLVPLCFSVFVYVKDLKLVLRVSLPMGKISTIVYGAHASVITVVGAVLRRLIALNTDLLNWVIFVVSLFACICLFAMISFLEKKHRFRWLKYAY